MPILKDSDVATAGVGSSPETSRGGQAWTLLSLLVALIALWGSLYLSLGMGLKACPLCYYQRTFVMGALGVLAIGWLAGARPAGMLELLALPCSVGGLGVAVFHEYLEQTGKLECPAGILGLGTAPQQSLAALVILTTVLILGLVRGGNNGGRKFVSSGAAMILGVLFAVAAVRSAAPAKIPQEPYKETLDICRPPYHPE